MCKRVGRLEDNRASALSGSGIIQILGAQQPFCDAERRWPSLFFSFESDVDLLHLKLWVFLLAFLGCGIGLAQTNSSPGEVSPIRLSPSGLLQERVSESIKRELPSFFEADVLEGQTEETLNMRGEVFMRRGDTVVKADTMAYDNRDDRMKAMGNVRVNKAGNVYIGPLLELEVGTFEGFFTQPSFSFLRNGAYGQASKIDFVDEQHAVIHDTTFTTCRVKPGPEWLPDWILRAQAIHINNETNEGQAEGAALSFKGVPILPIPSISFPLSSDRKSGLLPPTMGLDSLGGFEYTQPYYWNIAPNHDATIQATTWSKRGLSLGGEYRYLEQVNPDQKGQIRLDYMEHDLLRGHSRWGVWDQNQGALDVMGERLGLNVNIKRVSDDNYWRDFASASSPITDRLLPTDLALNWNHGALSSTLRSLKWQTLQDPTAPIIPPFDRLPQWTTRFTPYWGNLQLGVQTDVTRFEGADASLTCVRTIANCQTNGERALLATRMSYPVNLEYLTVTPKVSVLSRAYQFDTPLLSTGQKSASVSVPTFSLDMTTVLERPYSWAGSSYIQTLEPRVFFVDTPYRNQNYLPVYDTGRNDFNFATVYTENAFSGYDRVSDDKLLTMGATSRLIAEESGEERARFSIAQRFRYQTQRVMLPTDLAPLSDHVDDLLLGATLNLSKTFRADSTLQYDPATHESMQTKIGGRYYPSNYRLFSMAYSFQRDVHSELIDMAWQWPLNDLWQARGPDLGAGRGIGENKWFGVGRLNFDLQMHTVVNSIMGFEYDAGCWLGRIVLERLQVATNQVNQRIMFQLEFDGFTKVGISPLQTLKENIPRYQNLRDNLDSPSRFGNYD
jgi:LPS-assembly protein